MGDDGRTRYYGHGPDELENRLEQRTKPKTGLFGGNRSLTIIFIDIIIILVIYAIFVFFFSGPSSSRTIDGYRFSVSARRIESSALVTLRVTATEELDPAAVAAIDPILTVRFPTESEDDPRSVKDVLPRTAGGQRVFRHRLEVDAERESVSVEVEALGRSFSVTSGLGD
jgi:hypothetical protein